MSKSVASSDVSVVFQGPTQRSGQHLPLADNIRATRRWLPEATIILSTWRGAPVEADLPVDAVVTSDDPGPLPAFKYTSPSTPNNVNRQIVSSAAGLHAVKSPYALKLRTDCRLESDGILRMFGDRGRNTSGSERIVVPHLFSVDPRGFEQMPFHLSDWFQFGTTAKLQALWAAPLMQPSDASHYDRHSHADWSSRFDKSYRSRFATEQYVWRHYASGLGYDAPEFHNDIRPPILESHDRFVACETLIVDVQDAGLRFDRYVWALRSGLQRFNCLNHADWRALAAAHGDRFASRSTQRTAERRVSAKRFLSKLARTSEPVAPALKSPAFKPFVSRFLKTVDSWTRVRDEHH